MMGKVGEKLAKGQKNTIKISYIKELIFIIRTNNPTSTYGQKSIFFCKFTLQRG
jgi:hypothetical protein